MKGTGAGFPATKGVPLDGERIEAIYSMPVFSWQSLHTIDEIFFLSIIHYAPEPNIITEFSDNNIRVLLKPITAGLGCHSISPKPLIQNTGIE